MGNSGSSNSTNEALRNEWLQRLVELFDQLGEWAQELGWSLRRIEKPMQDAEVGKYVAPALVLQQNTTRILAEPIARTAPGVDGVVDIYLMPALDDIASLYYSDGQWQVHYRMPGDSTVGNIRQTTGRPLSGPLFAEILDAMTKNVV